MLIALCIAASVADAVKYKTNLVGGVARYDSFGQFVEYNIFSEAGAAMATPPVWEVLDIHTGDRITLTQASLAPAAAVSNPRSGAGTATVTLALPSKTTQVTKYSSMEWSVKSKPFGALATLGPKAYESDDSNRFTLNNLIFQTAGTYGVGFNVTLLSGEQFKFNQTFVVNRQPENVKDAVTNVAGYNGSTMFPAPTAQMVDYLGNDVPTTTVSISLVFQAVPTGANVSGVLTKATDAGGTAKFADINPSLPGDYIFRFAATKSDGQTIFTSSQRVTVQRALATAIVVHERVAGVSRLPFYKDPLFSIVDQVGASYDPRSNMSLIISDNQPDFSYEGQNTFATIIGEATVSPSGYFYRFRGLSIDLPGTYKIEVRLTLPTGTSAFISTFFTVRISPAPTYEVATTMTVNAIGTFTFMTKRPLTDVIQVKFATDVDCALTSSDVLDWPVTATTLTDTAYNMSIVPFNQADTYVCMRFASSGAWIAVVQHYLPQFDERYPQVFKFSVGGVSGCEALTTKEAARYNVAGWSTAMPGRSYGCALTPPVVGTVAPCSCVDIYTCEEMRHASFTPPDLNIGECLCCKPYLMAIAGCCASIIFLFIIYVILMWV
jgi:hypothetical protein